MVETKRQASQRVGILGEDLVTIWLAGQGWQILKKRWRSPWGEIDIIARKMQGNQSEIIFVEVKTRRAKNWDEDGLLAVSVTKQVKLWQAAELFVTQFTANLDGHLNNYSCRFDVALVNCQVNSLATNTELPKQININQSILIEGYQLVLHKYIESAFTVN
ncbi:MAG: YraN family protein [Microcoleaceae cyanobacterium]